MRTLGTVLALAAATAPAAPAAFAQSGVGEVSGVVVPRSKSAIGGFGTWEPAADSALVPRITLTPVRTLACTARPRTDCAPRAVYAHGTYGRYSSGPLSMGEYRMTVSAEGCRSVTRTLIVLSDSRSVEHLALTCRRF